MRVRIKRRGFFGSKRIDSESLIEDVLVKEDLFEKEKQRLSIYFRGENSSGIITLNGKEIEELQGILKEKTGLVRGRGKLKG